LLIKTEMLSAIVRLHWLLIGTSRSQLDDIHR